jgi:hypothetical protein
LKIQECLSATQSRFHRNVKSHGTQHGHCTEIFLTNPIACQHLSSNQNARTRHRHGTAHSYHNFVKVIWNLLYGTLTVNNQYKYWTWAPCGRMVMTMHIHTCTCMLLVGWLALLHICHMDLFFGLLFITWQWSLSKRTLTFYKEMATLFSTIKT